MIPSREHFLLKRRNALSTFSFSPTLTVDIPIFTILCQRIFYDYLIIIATTQGKVKPFSPLFSYFSVEKWKLLTSDGGLCHFFKIACGVFTPRTDKIVGKLALVDVPTNFTNPLFALRRRSFHLRFLFNIRLIVFVRHRFFVV